MAMMQTVGTLIRHGREWLIVENNHGLMAIPTENKRGVPLIMAPTIATVMDSVERNGKDTGIAIVCHDD